MVFTIRSLANSNISRVTNPLGLAWVANTGTTSAPSSASALRNPPMIVPVPPKAARTPSDS